LAYVGGTRAALEKRISNRTKSEIEPSREPAVESCPVCWGWIDRNRPQSRFEHQGPPPHPQRLRKRPEIFENEMDIPG
jgi:hypothetical protein